MDPFKNTRLAMKQFGLAIIITYFITEPIMETHIEETQCLDSIREIERERMT